VLTYGFNIITSTKKEIENFDVMARKILTEYNSHHIHSSVEHLYLPRHRAGCGLINIENLFYQKIALTAHHPLSSFDSLVQLWSKLDLSLPLRISILSRAKNFFSSLSINANIVSFLPTTLKQAICEKQLSLLIDSLIAKPLHGKYFSFLTSNDVDKADINR